MPRKKPTWPLMDGFKARMACTTKEGLRKMNWDKRLKAAKTPNQREWQMGWRLAEAKVKRDRLGP